jgi:hypothetical protein
VPDVAHDWLSIEVKHRHELPAWLYDAMLQAMLAAHNTNNLPIVVLHESGRRHDDDLVVVRLKDFVEWFGTVDVPEEVTT